MRSIKRLAALLLTMVMLALSGCAAARTSGPYSVYLISKSASTEFWKSVFAGANAAKSEYNVDLTILAPETEEEYEVQNDYIQLAIESRADAIIFSAISYTGNAPAIDEAIAAGIRVVVIDCDVDSDGVSVRIGTDNVAAGRMTGEAAMNAEEGDVVLGIVNCFVETQNCQERERGLREALLGDARVKGIYVVNVPTDAEQAKLAAERLLQEHPEICAPAKVLLEKIDPAGVEGLTPNSFSHQIRKSVDALRRSGITVSFRKSNGERLICLHRADGVDDSATAKSVTIDPVSDNRPAEESTVRPGGADSSLLGGQAEPSSDFVGLGAAGNRRIPGGSPGPL